MNTIKTTLLLLATLLTINSALAVNVTNDVTGKEKIGLVSAQGAYSLDRLTEKLSDKAAAEGASSMKIISAGGENKLYGVAEIYR